MVVLKACELQCSQNNRSKSHEYVLDFDISASALTAQSQRMNVSASNLANADSVAGPDGQPYRAKQVIFESRLQDAQNSRNGVAGVQVREVVEDQSPLRMEYRPGHPLANEDGYVAMAQRRPSCGNGQYDFGIALLSGQR